MSEKTHFKKAFKSPYLGSQDLPDYKDMNLTIEKVIMQESKGLKENSTFNIAYFTDVSFKPMLLNSTNSKRVSKLANSPYIEDWVNIEVTLTVKKVSAFGDIHDALRIREVTRKIQTSLPELNSNSKKWNEIIGRVSEGAKREVISKYYSVSDEAWNEILQKIEEQAKIDLKKEEDEKKLAKQKKKEEEDKVAKDKKDQEDKIDKFLDEE